MPDTLNHILAANLCLSHLQTDKPDLYRLLSDNSLVYRLGAMGMDLFFYYKPLSAKPFDANVRSMGSFLHAMNPNELFAILFGYVSRMQPGKAQDAMLSYVLGVVTHHALDSTCHPFIIYYSGGDGYEDGKDYDHSHKRFEQLLDTLVHERLQKERFSCDAFKKLDEEFIENVAALYNDVLQKRCNTSFPLQVYQKMLRDMILVQSLTKLKGQGILNFVFFLEKLTKKEYPFSRVVPVLSKKERALDLLNEQHAMWIYPMDGRVRSKESFLDLFQKSVALSRSHVKECYSAFIEKREEYSAIFLAIDFDSGLPCPRLPYRYIQRKI